jgi:hypothetical protein
MTVVAGRVTTPYFVVETAGHADVERTRLVDLNRLREANGVAPLEATMVVAETDDVVEHLRMLTTGLTRMREAEGLPPIRLVDLRTATTATLASTSATGSCGLVVQPTAC